MNVQAKVTSHNDKFKIEDKESRLIIELTYAQAMEIYNNTRVFDHEYNEVKAFLKGDIETLLYRGTWIRMKKPVDVIQQLEEEKPPVDANLG